MADADVDLVQLLFVRETVRAQTEILKATGWPSYFIASEMMVQAILMMVPSVTADQAREFVDDFWKGFIRDYKKKVDEAAAVRLEAAYRLDGGVLPFRRPANDQPPSDLKDNQG